MVLVLATLSDYKLAQQVTKVVTTQSTNAVINVAKSEQAFNNKVIDSLDTVPMLKYLWQKSSQDERATFLDFINKTN